jgi:uncharacterized membrane protein
VKYARDFVVNAVVGGLLVIVPIYLMVLLLLKAMQTAADIVRPVAMLIPDWLPVENLLSLLVVLTTCFVVGVVVRTPTGRAVRERMERAFFGRLPFYPMLRSLTQRLAGTTNENAWTPALVEIEDALVPAFIIEEHPDGRFTVFVPSVPTPLAGAVYILTRARVHPIDVPFTQAIHAISRWGAGSMDLVAGMRAPNER